MIDRREADSLSFEDAFRSLQEVVERLEKGSLPLDESVGLFAYGTELVRQCTALLDQAELKVRSLSQEPAAGDRVPRDFPDDDDAAVLQDPGDEES